jgi:hypothetical protein
VNTFKFSVCVFCGSRYGNKKRFKLAAEETGRMLAKNKWRLVYGAGDVGLMGALANSCQNNGGNTFGVIPKHLLQKEVGKTDLSTLIITENMHERKKLMFTNCNAIVTLPGGVGSLDEFFEILTWTQLEISTKPLYLLNIDGYWDLIIRLLDQMISQGFADCSLLNKFEIINSVTDLENSLINIQ